MSIRVRWCAVEGVHVRMRWAAGCVVMAGLAGAACGQKPVIAGIPGAMEWQNAPLAWKTERAGTLSITAGKQTDWFVSPMDGARRENSPRLLFEPADDFVLSARVTIDFRSQWDAGALVLYVTRPGRSCAWR